MKNFFEGIRTMQALRVEYKRLVKANHPDLGGDEATMKAINNQYEKAVEFIRVHGEQAEQAKAAKEVPAEFMAAVQAVATCKGLVIELVGNWIWITGHTYEHREVLKAAGYHYASKKKAWYWHAPEDSVVSHGRKSLNQIRMKYGCERIELDARVELAAAF